MRMSAGFVDPVYLFDYPLSPPVADYRPVVNAAGTTAIFERTTGGNPTTLYAVDIGGSGSNAQPFFQGSSVPTTATRPDWSWTTGQVAFAGNAGGTTFYIGFAGSDGSNPVFSDTFAGLIYPAYFPDGLNLATMNQAATALPTPNTTLITVYGGVGPTAVAGPKWWGGMPSVNPVYPNLIAFAGQPVAPHTTYDQNRNYIWIVDTDDGSVTPLEDGATLPYEADYQGRAPWWSPDGNWVAFESNRFSPPTSTNPDGLYSIMLYQYKVGPALQVTDPIYSMNHAKWLPQGFHGFPSANPTLIACAWQPSTSGAPALPYGIATLDVSSFVPTTG
jgi:hypothetical protein